MQLISQIFKLMNSEPTPTILIVGLGNRGREYRLTRHNAGFMVVDALCRAWKVEANRLHCRALVATTAFDGTRVVLAKPQTFMNLSGLSVVPLLRFYKAARDQLLVIHDDIDLPLGTIRIRPSGGAGGQKGLISIIEQLGTQQFARMRMGIGRPPGQMDAAAYVLRTFTRQEQEDFEMVLSRAVAAVETFISSGLEQAMNSYNGGAVEG